ncbi:unnamed protein product [Euphydryas editha]|uniref:Uncharacterized protein n=1 Tax=Euphydryas editha TaxID=104508 RepID=A0AAU9ULI3_EUPED|nr:unnamed protein product [Euphydryas editha]
MHFADMQAEGVKSRLSALAAAAELEADALRSRIRDKQDASQQRLESHLQAIREKATGPRQATSSESQDQIPKEVAEETGKFDQERKEREKQKAIKKKARKLKQKLLASGNWNPIFDDNITTLDTFLNPVTSKVYRVISSIRNIIAPFLEETNPNHVNGIEIEEDKPGKKKKGKVPNGDLEAEQKKETGKKKNDNHINSNTDANLNRDVKDSVKTEEPHTSTQAEKIPEEVEKEPKKKNKKKKNNNEDKAKLSKASSVCSSTSDMSRSSGRNDRKTKVDLDLPFLEKQMNELYRIMEKFEKQNITEKMAIQRFQAVKVIAQLLAVAAEKEDLNPPISAKCVCAGAALVARAMSACTASAAQLLATNTCVHLATLLARQLEKDLQSDQKEMDLAKQLADCLSVALDSVLCATRIHDEQGNKPKEEIDILVLLRNRAHQIIR